MTTVLRNCTEADAIKQKSAEMNWIKINLGTFAIIHGLSSSELNSSWQIFRWLSGPKVLKLNGLSSLTSTLNFQGQFVIGMDHFGSKMRQNAGE